MENSTDKKRINTLIETMLQIARGNYDCQLELSNNYDELDSLAMGVNMLIEDLKNNTLVEAQNKKIKEINQQLIRAKEKAEESDRLKSAFLANMSHEIRTPMNGILGFAELLKDPDVSQNEKLSFIEIIESSGLKLLSIINDLIDLSKIEAGMEKNFYTEVNVNEQLTNIKNFFFPAAIKKGLKINLHKPLNDEETFINIDQEKFYAILINLVNNALKYTITGSINFGYNKTSDQYIFYVKDTGIGISKSDQENIFARFIQSDISTTRKFEGSGLGLTITKSYIEMLGGKIWVESELGIGSEFFFTLPINPSSTIK